jgi:hypothetical protein
MAIPIAAYGRHAPVAEGVRQKLLPEYDGSSSFPSSFLSLETHVSNAHCLRREVVHTCLDLDAASIELPAVFGGDLEISSSSGLGTNVERSVAERATPKILFFGAGIPSEEIEAVSKAIMAKAPATQFVHVSPDDIRAAGGQGPDLDVISKVLKEKFGKLE